MFSMKHELVDNSIVLDICLTLLLDYSIKLILLFSFLYAIVIFVPNNKKYYIVLCPTSEYVILLLALA